MQAERQKEQKEEAALHVGHGSETALMNKQLLCVLLITIYFLELH